MPKADKTPTDQAEGGTIQAGSLNDMHDLDEEDDAEGVAPAGSEFNRVVTPITLVTLLIERDAATKIPTTVFEYEVPIIEEIHGADVVHVIEERAGETTLTAGEAHAQLMAKYKTDEHRLIIKSFFRDAKTLSRKSGLPMGSNDGARGTKGGKAPPAIDYSDTTSRRLMGDGEAMSQPETRRL